jgi:hypothetical protein
MGYIVKIVTTFIDSRIVLSKVAFMSNNEILADDKAIELNDILSLLDEGLGLTDNINVRSLEAVVEKLTTI